MEPNIRTHYVDAEALARKLANETDKPHTIYRSTELGRERVWIIVAADAPHPGCATFHYTVERTASVDSRPGLDPSTDLYFEAHVTLDPVFGDRRERLQEIVRPFGFKVAELLMRKRADGASVPSADDAFITARAVRYDVIRDAVQYAVRAMRAAGYKVRRYKIENTLVDSRSKGDARGAGDVWALLK